VAICGFANATGNSIDLSKSIKEKMPSPKPKIVVAKPMEEEAIFDYDFITD
jgi:hypothetical protein